MSHHFGFGFVRCLVVSQSGFPRLLRLRDLKSICSIQFSCFLPSANTRQEILPASVQPRCNERSPNVPLLQDHHCTLQHSWPPAYPFGLPPQDTVLPGYPLYTPGSLFEFYPAVHIAPPNPVWDKKTIAHRRRRNCRTLSVLKYRTINLSRDHPNPFEKNPQELQFSGHSPTEFSLYRSGLSGFPRDLRSNRFR